MEMFGKYITDEEQKLMNQYADYMLSLGFYSDGGGINCWRLKYGENYNDSFWAVDLYAKHKFSPSIYQFRWEFDGIHNPELVEIRDGYRSVCYKPKNFDEFKMRIKETVSKLNEYKKYKKQQIENKRLQKIKADF